MTTATWDGLVADVYTWTNRPAMVNETIVAIKSAIKTVHRQGRFWRDVSLVTATPTVAQIQTIDLSVTCPQMRQLMYLKSGTIDKDYREVEATGLLDPDGYALQDIYWGLGTTLSIRSSSPEASYALAYFKQPVTDPMTITADWLITDYSDAIVLLAASTIMALIGEQEIKARTDQLAALALAQVIADQLEVTGR